MMTELLIMISTIFFIVLLVSLIRGAMVNWKNKAIYYSDLDGNIFYTYENFLYLDIKGGIHHVMINSITEKPKIITDKEFDNYIKTGK